jgi:hypothetical protein
MTIYVLVASSSTLITKESRAIFSAIKLKGNTHIKAALITSEIYTFLFLIIKFRTLLTILDVMLITLLIKISCKYVF